MQTTQPNTENTLYTQATAQKKNRRQTAETRFKFKQGWRFLTHTHSKKKKKKEKTTKTHQTNGRTNPTESLVQGRIIVTRLENKHLWWMWLLSRATRWTSAGSWRGSVNRKRAEWLMNLKSICARPANGFPPHDRAITLWAGKRPSFCFLLMLWLAECERAR